MKLLAILLCLNFFNTTDTGEYGRYRVEIITTEGHQLKAYITISTYGELKTEFETDKMFKDYLLTKTLVFNQPNITCVSKKLSRIPIIKV